MQDREINSPVPLGRGDRMEAGYPVRDLPSFERRLPSRTEESGVVQGWNIDLSFP